MRALVTGGAGFIGSHLLERLLAEGFQVVVVDAFTDFYPRWMKENNLLAFMEHPACSFIEGDLLELPLEELLSGVDFVFHLAAQAGVRESWGQSFKTYTDNNILSTQRLLEAAKGKNLRKFIYASSSSIYGDAESLPTPETATPKPISPYGVTKLAAEHLCQLYFKAYDVPTVSLRLFTFYGPRQRPDMAFRRFIQAILEDRELTVYGDGQQTRDFTYVQDGVGAFMLALERAPGGTVFNVGGGSRVSLMHVIAQMGEILGQEPKVRFQAEGKGEARHTGADISKARELLSYHPKANLREGLERQVEWQLSYGRPPQ